MSTEIKTTALPDMDAQTRAALKQAMHASSSTTSLTDKREVLLMVDSDIKRVVLWDETYYYLGRFDSTLAQSGFHLDLSPYKARENGVSRVHAQLHVENRKLYITDLGSTNGTYLMGQRLQTNVPSLLHNGDEIVIGRLSIKILFR